MHNLDDSMRMVYDIHDELIEDFGEFVITCYTMMVAAMFSYEFFNANELELEGYLLFHCTMITIFVNLRLSLVSNKYMDHKNMV